MAKPVSVVANTTKPGDRSYTIAEAIRGALAPITGADELTKEANEALAGAKGEGINARELVMGNLAELATTGEWTEQDINIAAVLMGKQSNNEMPKSIATFIGEAKMAMHPNVREEFLNVVGVRNDAWEAESLAREIDKAAPNPIKKAFARKYHLLVTLMGEAREGRWYTTVEELTAYAVLRDPDIDAKKSLKTLTKARELLQEIANNFPVADLIAGLDTLNKVVTEAQLVEARAELLGEVPTTVVAQPNAQRVASGVPVKPAFVPASTIVEEASNEVADGAVDLLDGILENNTVDLIQQAA